MPRKLSNINDLTSPEIVKQLYAQYYLRNVTPDRWVSSHWEEFGKKIDVRIDKDGTLTSLKGYGFGDLESSRLLSKIVKYMCNLSYFIRTPYKKDLIFLGKTADMNVKKIGSFLSYDCFRQLCSLCAIRRHLDIGSNEKFDALVIGDGYGFLSSVLKSIYPNLRITLIDIGKILLFQARNLQLIHPGAVHMLINGTADISAGDFLYVPAEKSGNLKGRDYKLIINIASFQEMNYPTIDSYFKLMRSNAAPDNLFYCCNRVSKTLFAGEIIEFLKYPWCDEDKRIIDELCPFYRYYFSGKYPFIRKFDGPIRHRLANLKTGA